MSLFSNETFLVFSFEPWSPQPRNSLDELMAVLARENRIVFVERQAEWHNTPKKRYLRRLLGKVRVRQEGNYTVVTPAPLLPLADRMVPGTFRAQWTRAIIGLSKARLIRQVRGVLNRQGIRRPILWVTQPQERPLLGHLGEKLACYYVFDEVTLMPGWSSWRAVLDRWEQDTLRRVDVVFASSRSQWEKRRGVNPETHLLANAVALDRFSLHPAAAPPADVVALARPVLGVVGQVDFRIDLDLVRYLARERPSWSFVFLGVVHSNVAAKVTKLQRMGNVHFLGHRPPEDLRPYLAAMDACLVPFVVTEVTRTMLPLRLFTYLAAEKPVIATDLPELYPYRAVARVARSYPEFLAALEEELRTDSAQKRAARLTVARENTWEARGAEVSRVLAAHLHPDAA